MIMTAAVVIATSKTPRDVASVGDEVDFGGACKWVASGVVVGVGLEVGSGEAVGLGDGEEAGVGAVVGVGVEATFFVNVAEIM